MESLEDRIKKARKHANLTHPQLADAIGVSRRAVIGYQKNASAVSVLVVQKIARACQVNEIWLLTGHGQMDGNQEAPPENITKVIVEHQDLIKKFKDPDTAKEANEALIELEDLDQDLYQDVVKHIKSSVNAARVIKKATSKKTSEVDQDHVQNRKTS
ncbi:MAG: helix-turn-helix domain-containing protein [Desulfotignum sp.]|nr:helix-turn-helix domain-containing protein [Desulfotignum sp.]